MTTTKRKKNTCSICGQSGHNKATHNRTEVVEINESPSHERFPHPSELAGALDAQIEATNDFQVLAQLLMTLSRTYLKAKDKLLAVIEDKF